MPLLGVDKGFVSRIIGTRAHHIVFTLIILALAGPAIYRGYRMFRSDRIVRSEQTVESFTRAIEMDPGNAALWWHRGQLRHYAVEAVDIPQAILDYQKALSINPRLSQAWVDVADCYERTARYAEAEDAFRHALATHAYSPLTHWQAGNFFLRRGNLAQMYECFKMASAYDPGKLGIAMDIAWKIDPERGAILEKLIPDNLAANLSYLDFLVSRDELDLARAAWLRALKNDPPTESEFKIASSFGYIDHLVDKNRVEDAERVWDEALHKSGSNPGYPRIGGQDAAGGSPAAPNLIWNGSFEDEIVNGGFDWRYAEMKEVEFEVDLTDRLEGLKSLKVTFGGANIQFAHLSQIVPIPHPGNYVLEVYLRTQGLTTNRKPYLSIQGYPEASGAALSTEPFPETTPWEKRSYTFAVKDKCKAVKIMLRRDPSARFDNQIKGSLWLDKISIRAGK
ncbi:MAG: tetratricopeptide repeat protein [Acidobacteriota bacterium]